MSSPKGHNSLWKNCTWESKEEKLAFFNHYFKKSEMVTDRVNSEVKRIKGTLMDLIKAGKIKLDKNKTRPLTIEDIKKELEGL